MLLYQCDSAVRVQWQICDSAVGKLWEYCDSAVTLLSEYCDSAVGVLSQYITNITIIYGTVIHIMKQTAVILRWCMPRDTTAT